MSRLSPSSLRTSRAPLRHGLGAAVLALGFMTGAQAGLFDDEEARQQILQLRTQLDQTQRSLGERIGELEAQARNRSIIDLFNQVEALKADFAKLRGQIEMLQNELDNSQKRQRDLYVDLDGRLRKIETQLAASATPQAAPGSAPSGTVAPAPATGAPAAAEPPRGLPSAPAVTPPAIDPVAEQRSYEAGLDLFRSGRFSEAIASFQSFLRTFSRSTLAPSAQYWIGNALYATRDYRGAITAQRQLLAQYPDSAKAPDALLNIATAQSDLGDLQGARSSLQEVIAKYPNSEAATKARQRLGGR